MSKNFLESKRIYDINQKNFDDFKKKIDKLDPEIIGHEVILKSELWLSELFGFKNLQKNQRN